MTIVLNRLFLFLYLVVGVFSASAAGYTVNGGVVDPDGSPLSRVSVQLNMMGGMGRGPVASSAGLTDALGRFSILVSDSGIYRVCTSGAAAPLLDLCSAAAESHVLIPEGASSVPLEISLEKGVTLVVSVADKYSRLNSLKIGATLSIDPFLIASPSSEMVSDSLHRFVFAVPLNSSGALILISTADGFFDEAGTLVPSGVPALRWSAGTEDAQITLQLK